MTIISRFDTRLSFDSDSAAAGWPAASPFS
jgi:hypothetical protein